MFRVTKHIEFCYGHRLLNYEGKCRHLHGHNGRVEVHIEADRLDARGMVYDFSEIKEAIKNWIEREGVGVYDVVTFPVPVPKGYKPVMKPEFPAEDYEP